jgi:hypothetical protein
MVMIYKRPSDERWEGLGNDPNNPFISVCNYGGRSFIVQWPYVGLDSVELPVMQQLTKSCKILGFAKRGTKNVILSQSQVSKYIVENDEIDT